VYGDGTQTRSFCFVSDEVEGFYRLLMSDEPGPVNIGNDRETTMLELATLINEITGNKAGIVFRPLPNDDPRVRRPDLSKAHAALGWAPSITLEDGLQRTIDWFRGQMQLS